MQPRYALIENFFPEADRLRSAVDAHFAEPMRHDPARHQIWNYWYVPEIYTYLRTSPEKVVGAELAQRFFEHLRRHAFETYGLGKVYWPYLSVYVAGCHQALHNDSRGGRIGYVYSLTNWDGRNFAGGETLLFKEGSWSGDSSVSDAKGARNFYDLIPPRFNQLLVFDDRVPHAVQRLEGTMAPGAGRIVLHGHFAEAGITIEGALASEQHRLAIASLDAATKQRVASLGSCYHGLIVIRLEIAADGRVGRSALLWDRVYALTPDTPPYRVDDLTALLLEHRFPAAAHPSRVTLPIAIGIGLG
ncbi:MAG: hypothetical protein ACREFI_08635 [Stellaceae bacterium]